MAKRLSKIGYGQLELNSVAFRRDGRIEAQCKLASDIEYVENGMLLAIDQATRTVSMPTGNDDLIALNYTTEHMYDERLLSSLRNFKLDNGTFLPRLGYLAAGDKFTTNCVAIAEAEGDFATIAEVEAAGVYGHASEDGYILVNNERTGALLKVAEITTMPDGQPAVKFVAI